MPESSSRNRKPSNKRERELARAREQRRTSYRLERERARRRRIVVAGVVVGAVAVGAGTLALLKPWEADPEEPPADTQAASVTCTYNVPPVSGEAKPAREVEPPSGEDVSTLGTVDVAVATSAGPLQLELTRSSAPCAVNSFLSLAEQGFFDDTPCHRLTTADALSVLQCGDPSGTGRGGPGYSYETEPPALQGVYPRGAVAIANAGVPGSNGSQFFIVFKDSQLPPSYSLIGVVAEGIETVDAVAAAGTADGAEDGAPKNPVTLVSVTPAA